MLIVGKLFLPDEHISEIIHKNLHHIKIKHMTEKQLQLFKIKNKSINNLRKTTAF